MRKIASNNHFNLSVSCQIKVFKVPALITAGIISSNSNNSELEFWSQVDFGFGICYLGDLSVFPKKLG